MRYETHTHAVLSGLPLGFYVVGYMQILSKRLNSQASVFQRLDSAVHRINHYPVDSVLISPLHSCWIVIYPVDSAIQCLNNRDQELFYLLFPVEVAGAQAHSF